MNVPRSTEDIIRIPSTPLEMQKLLEQVHHPDQLDKVVTDLHIPAFLLNFYLATPADLSSIGLGKAVHIPAQITEREGGRKSLYYLNPGEEVLTGIFVTSQGIALSFIKRDTGNTLPAQTGDLYSTRVTNLEGEVILQEQAELEVIGPSIGYGRFIGKIGVNFCILWSIIRGPGYTHTASMTVYSYYGAIESQDYSTAYKCLDASRATLGIRHLSESLFLETAQALDAEKGKVSAFSVSSIIDSESGGLFTVNVTRNGQSYDVHLAVEPPWLNERNLLLIVDIDNI
jgi:hypothetical protein